MKQIYTTPRLTVAKAQLRATLLAGSNNRPTIPGGGGTDGFDTRERRNLLVD